MKWSKVGPKSSNLEMGRERDWEAIPEVELKVDTSYIEAILADKNNRVDTCLPAQQDRREN